MKKLVETKKQQQTIQPTTISNIDHTRECEEVNVDGW